MAPDLEKKKARHGKKQVSVEKRRNERCHSQEEFAVKNSRSRWRKNLKKSLSE